MPSRRSFLKGLAASPLVAKAAAEDLMLHEAGTNVIFNPSKMAGATFEGMNGLGEALELGKKAGSMTVGDVKKLAMKKLALSYLESYSKDGTEVPEWVRKLIEGESDYSTYSLDIDVQVLKSVATQHKYRMQWKRNKKETLRSSMKRLKKDITWFGHSERDDHTDNDNGMLADVLKDYIY